MTIRNKGTGTTVVALDPNGSETIDGATTMHLFPGEVRLIICDGSNFNTIMLNAGSGLYVQITSSVNVASTTESSGTSIMSFGSLTFDAVQVEVEFWAIEVDTPTGAADFQVTVSLFDSTTQLTQLAIAWTNTTNGRTTPVTGKYRFTPSAGAHTYALTAYASNTTGPPSIRAGAGGTGTRPPAYCKITKTA